MMMTKLTETINLIILPQYKLSYEKDKFTNIPFIGKMCNELFTTPLLFARDTIYFCRILNSFYSLEETSQWTFKILGIFPTLN